MLKVAIIGVMAVFLAIPLKKDKAEFGMLIILSACLLILMLSIDKWMLCVRLRSIWEEVPYM